jgi:hypothetical protein
MKILARYAIAVLVVTLLGASTGRGQGQNQDCGFGTGHSCYARDTPEIDPGMGGGALALIGGAALVLRGRRKA